MSKPNSSQRVHANDWPTPLHTRVAAALRQAFGAKPPRLAPSSVGGGEDLLAWCRRLLPEHFSMPPSAMHRWLADRLDGFAVQRGQKVSLIGPRGGAKSTIATLGFVLRAAVEAAEPYLWIVSDTKDQAKTHLENVKTELLENRLLACNYPHAVGRGPRWQATAIELSNGVVIEAYGTGQRIRGRRRRAHRPTAIICDDLQNDRHIASASGRESSRQWFHGTLLKAGTPSTNIVNLATALHRDGLALELDRAPGWDTRLFRAVEAWPIHQSLWDEWQTIYCDADRTDARLSARIFYDDHRAAMDAGAKLLWPELEDLYTLMQMRVESGATAFEREKQGSPVDPDKCEWPDSYFDDHIWFDDWPSETRLRTMSLDPSKGADARNGDYSALVMLAVDANGVLYIDADLARRPTPRMVADGVDWFLKFRPDAFAVEANQWQQLLSAEFVAEFQRRGVLGVTPCEIHNHTNKNVRIRRLGPYLSQRRILFRRGSPSTELLVNQLRDFPIAAHDDGPDALEMALRLAEEVWQGRHRSDGLGDRLAVEH